MVDMGSEEQNIICLSLSWWEIRIGLYVLCWLQLFKTCLDQKEGVAKVHLVWLLKLWGSSMKGEGSREVSRQVPLRAPQPTAPASKDYNPQHTLGTLMRMTERLPPSQMHCGTASLGKGQHCHAPPQDAMGCRPATPLPASASTGSWNSELSSIVPTDFTQKIQTQSQIKTCKMAVLGH